jgi:hypothetical protein
MASGKEGPTFSNGRMKQWNPRLLCLNQYPPVDHEGWMVSGQETVFCWVPVPWLTMVASSVGFFSYLLIHLLVCR